MDLEEDLVPALQRLQQRDVTPMLHSVLRHTEAESRHRRYMDAQLAAHRQKQANLAQHAQQAQRAQQGQQAQHARQSQVPNAQQFQQLTCCQSSTKPQKPRASVHHSQHIQHARLRHEAENLHQSSRDGKYWQADSNSYGSSAPTQHETLISLGERVRNRAVRTRLMYNKGNSADIIMIS